MDIPQKDIDEAIKKQTEYWDSLKKNLVFFTKLSTPIDFGIFDLPNYDDMYYFRINCDSTEKNAYPWLARYWASNALEYHINFLWLTEYNSYRDNGLKEKEAAKIADADREKRVKTFKASYP